jgi:hypothetical protein
MSLQDAINMSLTAELDVVASLMDIDTTELGRVSLGCGNANALACAQWSWRSTLRQEPKTQQPQKSHQPGGRQAEPFC